MHVSSQNKLKKSKPADLFRQYTIYSGKPAGYNVFILKLSKK